MLLPPHQNTQLSSLHPAETFHNQTKSQTQHPKQNHGPSPNPVKACNLLDPDLCTRISLLFPALLFDFLLPTAVTFDTLVLLSNELEFEETEE
jgi:hypothetical protein